MLPGIVLRVAEECSGIHSSWVLFITSLVASHLGKRIMGLAMNLLSANHALDSATDAFMAGILYDLYAQYDVVWISSIGVAVAAGLMVFTIRENRQPAA